MNVFKRVIRYVISIIAIIVGAAIMGETDAGVVILGLGFVALFISTIL